MLNPRFERELIYLEREIRSLLMQLENKKTKSLGKAFAERTYDTVNLAIRLTKMVGSPRDQEAMHLVRRRVIDLKPTHSRERGIEALKNALDIISSAKTSISDTRVGEIQNQVKELQAQIREVITSSEEAPSPDISAKLKVDISETNTVFVIMPFNESFDDVWTGGIVRAATAVGFKAVRVDMIDRSSNITDDIVDSVEKCHLAIVDVTDNNPNVMFELGYALAKEKSHIIISQSAEFLPFDIRQIRTIVYSNTWSGIEELNSKIQDFLREFKKTKPKKNVSTRRKK